MSILLSIVFGSSFFLKSRWTTCSTSATRCSASWWTASSLGMDSTTKVVLAREILKLSSLLFSQRKDGRIGKCLRFHLSHLLKPERAAARVGASGGLPNSSGWCSSRSLLQVGISPWASWWFEGYATSWLLSSPLSHNQTAATLLSLPFLVSVLFSSSNKLLCPFSAFFLKSSGAENLWSS